MEWTLSQSFGGIHSVPLGYRSHLVNASTKVPNYCSFHAGRVSWAAAGFSDSDFCRVKRPFGFRSRAFGRPCSHTLICQSSSSGTLPPNESGGVSYWRTVMEQRYRPQLVITSLIPIFQQLTGINVIMFYAPVLFKTLGFGDDAALMSAVVSGLVNVFATIVSIIVVDRFGRRLLFLEGGIQMILCQLAVGILTGSVFGVNGEGSFSKSTGDLALVLICFYVAAFAWSWGPLGWLVPSEIHPLEIRSPGQSINVSLNMLLTFVIGQLFLSMLCGMKFGLFFFFAGWVVVMTAFVYFFLPETKGVPIEEVNKLWKKHWFWRRYFPEDAEGLHLPSTSRNV